MLEKTHLKWQVKNKLNVWQNQCNGRGRRKRRSPRSRAPPYWLDPSNTLTVDDPPPQEDPSDLPHKIYCVAVFTWLGIQIP